MVVRLMRNVSGLAQPTIDVHQHTKQPPQEYLNYIDYNLITC